MLQLSNRWIIGGTLLCSLITGCASPSSEVSPSLLGKLRGEPQGVQQASYNVEAKNDLNPKKIKDPLTLKLHYARWAEQMNEYPDARRNYTEVLEERPENFDAILGLARIDQASGDNVSAEAGFRRAMSLQPDSPIAQHALGQFMLSQGRVTESLPLLQQALMGQPADKACRYHLAEALAKSGDIQGALPHFQQTVGAAAAHYNVGTVLHDRGDYQGAEQHFRQSLMINPQLERARGALATLPRHHPSANVAQAASRGVSSQGAPMRSPAPQITPAAHHMSTPVNSLTPAQRQQLSNQQRLSR